MFPSKILSSLGTMPHYRRTLLCRVPAAHGEMRKPHGKTLAVRQSTAKTTRRRRPRRRLYAVSKYKTARQNVRRMLLADARQSKATNVARVANGNLLWAQRQSAVSTHFAVRSGCLCREPCFVVFLLSTNDPCAVCRGS
jgi:hypothetical protein